MGKLAAAALALGQVRSLNPLGIFAGTEEEEKGWKEEDGLRYLDFNTRVRDVSRKIFADAPLALDCIDFECIDAVDIAPHYHKRSSSVVKIVSAADFEGYFQLTRTRHVWVPLFDGQMLTIEPWVPHGFRRRSASSETTLLMVVASFPAVTDGDTYYV
jgi:hypothetical protein